MAAAVRYAKKLTSDHLVVVVLPDSGSRYLSKVFDDEWMRGNGFLETDWADVSLGDVLAAKSFSELKTVSRDNRMTDVVALLKEFDISQVPVVKPDGTLEGMVNEVDLLKHMLEEGHAHTQDETIAQIIQPLPPCLSVDTPLEDVLHTFVDEPVSLVVQADRPVGILTKIDVLDYITHDI